MSLLSDPFKFLIRSFYRNILNVFRTQPKSRPTQPSAAARRSHLVLSCWARTRRTHTYSTAGNSSRHARFDVVIVAPHLRECTYRSTATSSPRTADIKRIPVGMANIRHYTTAHPANDQIRGDTQSFLKARMCVAGLRMVHLY